MKIVTWNVGGLRACIRKGFLDYVENAKADIILVQETHINEPLDEINALTKMGYYSTYSFADRKGYSGTLILHRKKPKKIALGLDNKALDNEGRIITLSFEDFHVINVYVPNSTANLKRKYFRHDFDIAFREHITSLTDTLPVIIGGDFNVARSFIDVFPENTRNEENPSGFDSEERDNLEQLLNIGLIDVHRHMYPDAQGIYTWWSNRLNKRLQNRGWRIDYFLVSDSLIDNIDSINTKMEIQGSDHCPIELVLSL